MLDPAGRVVMISGANRGIGAATAARLRAAGYRLSLGVRQPATLADAAGDDCLVSQFEARLPGAATSWVAATLARFGRIDAVVNNAGITKMARVEDEDESVLDELWEVNVKGPLRLVRAALPHLKSAGEGRVVTVASLSGKRVRNENAGYAMSKFAAVALTHSIRRLGWEHGIRATAICPGFVATDMSAAVTAMPRAQMTQPGEVAELVALVLALPNNAAIAELLVNCRLEEML